MIKKKNRGFTLVEVLICVGIIGIIAAISIPALLSSTSQKALEAQRKAFHSRMAQAFAQMKSLNNYKDATVANSATNLLIGLSGSYKISKICPQRNISQCGVPDVVYDYYDDTRKPRETKLSTLSSLSTLNTNIEIAKWGGEDVSAAAFKTVNGESALVFYNPNCRSKKETAHDLVYSVCVNIIYDLNGKNQPPNTYGEDIGYMTVFYPANSTLVAPLLNNKKSYTGKFSQMLSTATAEDMVPASLEELTSILINQTLTQITSESGANGLHWSSSYAESGTTPKVWLASITAGAKTQEYDDATSESYRYYLLKK